MRSITIMSWFLHGPELPHTTTLPSEGWEGLSAPPDFRQWLRPSVCFPCGMGPPGHQLLNGGRLQPFPGRTGSAISAGVAGSAGCSGRWMCTSEATLATSRGGTAHEGAWTNSRLVYTSSGFSTGLVVSIVLVTLLLAGWLLDAGAVSSPSGLVRFIRLPGSLSTRAGGGCHTVGALPPSGSFWTLAGWCMAVRPAG